MERRHFLKSGAAAAVVAGMPVALRAQAGGDAALNALFDRIFDVTLDRSPQMVTQLGLDKGSRAGAKSQLNNVSEAAMRADLASVRRAISELEAFPVAGLSESAALNREIILYGLRAQTVSPEKFGVNSVIRPYRIFQQGGAYFNIPDFLDSAHVIATRADADAYLARLEAFSTMLDQDTAVQSEQARRGYLAPAFSLDLTLSQMAALRNVPAADSNMVRSLVRRAAKAGVSGDYAAPATKIVETKIYPALDRQIALIRRLRPTTRAGDGVWRLDDGAALYAAALRQSTTTDLSAADIHAMGLEQVAAISADLDRILRAQGMTQGGVGQRLTALNADPSQLYADTPEGRAALLASLNQGVKAMYAKLPRAFAAIPSTALEIRAVPVEIQDGASNGYYRRAALDGSRPAIYFINMKDLGDWPKYSLPALTYHEGVPGHHLQISLSQESKDIPMLRKIGFFGAYTEGWALYAEQLADELGGYASPLERAGYLQSFLFRAARLVVDTGIHTKKWDREKATDYLVETTGFARPRSQREVERYCTQPGQACSYKVGHMAWTRARESAQQTLGDRFDLKQFHGVLNYGAMPLTIMEGLVARRTAAARA